MNTLTLNSTVQQQNEKLLSSDLGDEIVMMNIENGDYMSLNEAGNSIWRLMAQPIKVQQICEALQKVYAVPPEKCEASVLRILGEMQQEEIVTIVAS